MAFKVGDQVIISRKPKANEPLSDFWDSPTMDHSLGLVGKVVAIDIETHFFPNGSVIDIEIVEIYINNQSRNWYPYYCISKHTIAPTISCSCKLELLITRGCRCGAIVKEKNSKF